MVASTRIAAIIARMFLQDKLFRCHASSHTRVGAATNLFSEGDKFCMEATFHSAGSNRTREHFCSRTLIACPTIFSNGSPRTKLSSTR